MFRTLLAILLALHGVIHLLGLAKAFGFAKLPALTLPFPRSEGVWWAIAAVLLLIACALLIGGSDRWWMPAAIGVVLSQVLIVMHWQEARFGTIANALLLVAVIAGAGVWNFRMRYTTAVAHTLERTNALPVQRITEADLAPLPLPVQRYLRAAGVMGTNKPRSMRIAFEGSIRGFDGPWMPFTTVQVNSFYPPARFFWLDATMKGLPTKGLHAYEQGKATMLIKLLGIVPVMEAHGPEMDKGETVTWFNDLCIYAPGALLDPRITWADGDDHSAKATFTHGDLSITATLVFDDADRLVDFISDDRYAMAANGTAVSMRFSTPLRDHRPIDQLILPGYGEAVWHRPDGPFVYGRFTLRSLTYDLGN
ncbi:MAG: hypothetical protein MUE88_04045 [Flavobacteriales bacterium]|jgi:hypothetical protein|nr:hypothetical protein [Flavobacteriales bacterium]